MVVQTINLDVTPGGIKPVIHISQYDSLQLDSNPTY